MFRHAGVGLSLVCLLWKFSILYGFVSTANDVLEMSVVRGVRGVVGVCEMCMYLARGGVGLAKV